MSIVEQLSGWFHRRKDASTSFLVERLVQRPIARYGRMLDFKIDSREKTARIELLLKGEHEPITVDIRRYEIISEPSGSYLVVSEASVSREWMTAFFDQFIRGKRIAIPENYAKLIKLIV